MSKVRLTATIACFQIRKKNGRKSLSFIVRVYLNLQLRFFIQFRVCKQQRHRSASAPAQFLESRHAKNKIPVRHACADPDNSNKGGGGGKGRIASRGRFVPVFLLGNKWQLMIFMGRSGPPAPSVNKHTGSEVSAHIRVSNSLNSHFIYFFSQNVC